MKNIFVEYKNDFIGICVFIAFLMITMFLLHCIPYSIDLIIKKCKKPTHIRHQIDYVNLVEPVIVVENNIV